jgi:hypothetical protein
LNTYKSLSSEETQQITTTLYRPHYRQLWNDFVDNSKNGVFLFKRNYMEYHQKFFMDHSLMFFRDQELVGIMPANLKSNTLHSHAGLTFGGVVSNSKMTTPLMLKIFDSIIEHAREQGIEQIIYKNIPYIYHSVPANEDLYALFLHNAKLIARNASSSIYMPNLCPFDRNREDNIRKAKRNGLSVRQSLDFGTFMKIEAENLAERHHIKPVHTGQEIQLLAQRFPDNIKLFASYKGDLMIAGVVVYVSKNVAHMQYAANSRLGRSIGAQDIIEDYLIREIYRDKSYFDFGISTEKFGQVLNVGLISRKEDFGASAVMYDSYQMVI